MIETQKFKMKLVQFNKVTGSCDKFRSSTDEDGFSVITMHLTIKSKWLFIKDLLLGGNSTLEVEAKLDDSQTKKLRKSLKGVKKKCLNFQSGL